MMIDDTDDGDDDNNDNDESSTRYTSLVQVVQKELQANMKPEFLNRLNSPERRRVRIFV